METQELEPQQNKANATLERKPWHFTPEQARQLQAKSMEARKAKREAMQAELEQAQREAEQARAIVLADAMSKPKPIAIEPEEQYRLTRLARTREQIEQLDKQLEAETDPKAIKSLADALARMVDVEFALAKRPKPGAFRPVREKQARASQQQGPIED
jgi:hypothetical protein